jgi:hypothetical protein
MPPVRFPPVSSTCRPPSVGLGTWPRSNRRHRYLRTAPCIRLAAIAVAKVGCSVLARFTGFSLARLTGRSRIGRFASRSRSSPAHLPSVRVSLRYGDLSRTFCALTHWNVLSYRHCCRGIATVTRSVARCPLPAWQLVASSFKLVAGASSTANSGPFWGNVWQFAPPRVVTSGGWCRFAS